MNCAGPPPPNNGGGASQKSEKTVRAEDLVTTRENSSEVADCLDDVATNRGKRGHQSAERAYNERNR
jgi:hypothetical protein